MTHNLTVRVIIILPCNGYDSGMRVLLFCSLGVLSRQEFLRDPPPMQTQTIKPK